MMWLLSLCLMNTGRAVEQLLPLLLLDIFVNWHLYDELILCASQLEKSYSGGQNFCFPVEFYMISSWFKIG